MTAGKDFRDPMVICEQTLLDLKRLLPADAAASLLARFRTDLDNTVVCVMRHESDPAEIASAAHRLISIAGALGLEELSLRASELACSMKSSPSATVPDAVISGLRSAYERACNELDRFSAAD